MQNPGFHFFFVLGKGKNGRLLGYGQRGVVREVTAAGVVVVSTGSGSLRLREKGGLYVFIFAFLFHFYLSYLPLCFLTSIYRSILLYSLTSADIFLYVFFIYLLTYSLCFFTVCFSSYSCSTSPYSFFYLSIFIRLSVSVRAHECLSLGV